MHRISFNRLIFAKYSVTDQTSKAVVDPSAPSNSSCTKLHYTICGYFMADVHCWMSLNYPGLLIFLQEPVMYVHVT